MKAIAPLLFLFGLPLVAKDGSGAVEIRGELKTWHKISLVLDGPFAAEKQESPNPFTDLSFSVRFTHESGKPEYVVPGYFAADGDAANSSADEGTKWCAHLAPDLPGVWSYRIFFNRGVHAAVDGGGEAFAPYDGQSGSFEVVPSDRQGRDFRAKGRLEYVGRHHLRFAGSGEYFLKAGPDAPETLLAFTDFDGTTANKPAKAPLKAWKPHVKDWNSGDPMWKDGRGKGLIGALNYLAGKGLNSFSFLTYNAGGDGDNVWPFTERGAKLHYDCSKLDQWGIVFDHATAKGLHLHFKLQENELDDNRRGNKREAAEIAESLDGGKLGVERKLYCRELVARYGHNLAMNWNIGEENTQSSDEVRDMAAYLREIDPYDHPIVLHTFPEQQDEVYTPLLGEASALTGVSLQNPWDKVHQRTHRWIEESDKAGRPWVVANDEQNPAGLGVPPDIGYRGGDGIAKEKSRGYTMHDIRKLTLWGNLLAGGGGVEYYFGYSLPENDLLCEDFRSRDRSWDYCRIALECFRDEKIPFWEMKLADPLVENPKRDNSRYCFAKAGEIYFVYLPTGGSGQLDLKGVEGTFAVQWFNPREGGKTVTGSVDAVAGGSVVALGEAPVHRGEDWLVVVRKR